jgi:hypothetical protein
MSRIEPIAAARALVRYTRDSGRDDARRSPDAPVLERRRRRRPATAARPALGDAAAAAAFEVHRLSNGGARGLKADLAVRRLWSDAYESAAATPGPRPIECARA